MIGLVRVKGLVRDKSFYRILKISFQSFWSLEKKKPININFSNIGA